MSFNKFAFTLAAAALAGAAIPVRAADPAPAAPAAAVAAPDAPSTVQKAAMRLGYTLQSLADHQRGYLADVQGLSSIDEGEATDKYVNDLVAQSHILRKFEANAVTLVLDDLVKIEGPEKALQSITPLSQMLTAPLPSNKKKESKDKRVTAILATIDEVRVVQDDMTSLQFNLTPILKLQGGDEALWAIELGRTLAARRAGSLTKASLAAQTRDITSLVSRAPKTLSPGILESVRALAPPPPSIAATGDGGGGNLAGLLPSDAPAPPTAAAHAAERALLAAYGASDVDEKLGNGK
ncbi:hypothetical protein CCAX7_29350 [Capsulimonas corticalis]|uniref:Uncharacterized protein n=1 Tax=Capsulimonas corticalis TaxID=2219043 RepID=A0A402CT20_9BACT|nr:hypothetical protein [Capsulimonas corticalis]BDI30884.1 hypothetical protein CCAX7_29350 [Capsulimonas corticalis]